MQYSEDWIFFAIFAFLPRFCGAVCWFVVECRPIVWILDMSMSTYRSLSPLSGCITWIFKEIRRKSGVSRQLTPHLGVCFLRHCVVQWKTSTRHNRGVCTLFPLTQDPRRCGRCGGTARRAVSHGRPCLLAPVYPSSIREVRRRGRDRPACTEGGTAGRGG